MTKKKRIIAIDGFSSCGKSTFAKFIASELDYLYIDSGAMYRAVTLFGISKGFVSKDLIDKAKLIESLDKIKIDFIKNATTGKIETYLNDENVENEIRNIEVAQAVSPVSQIAEIRKIMVDQQRKLSENKGVVMDGRDIGTVVFPNADLKIFMTASPEIRAKRRFDELMAKGILVNMDEIRQNIEDRDHKDSTRKESPLFRAGDAILLDNSYMTPEEQMIWFRKIAKDKISISD